LAPEVWYHPPQPGTPRPDGRGGEELVRINCDTCHDPHQAAGAKPSADAVRFLRHASAETVCADCHREDALRRYAFFHDRQRRRR
jgi:predicted CXXCH cytochrome family protein